MAGRRSKLVPLQEALAAVSDGCTLAVGGLWFHNKPMAALRELIRRGVRHLTLIAAPPSSLDSDLLIGAGLVKDAYLAHVSFEHLGLAPNFRHAVEHGLVELHECDEATLLGGLMATLEGLPYHPISSLRGTDHLRTSPLAMPYIARDGSAMVAAPALKPDVAILHAQEADEYGNVRCFGAPFVDPIFAKTASHVIVTVDKLVSNGEVRQAPSRTTIPGYLVDAVVEAPFGAHPCSSHGLHPHDEAHLRGYLAASNAALRGIEPGAFQAYLQRYVFACHSHDEYLEAIGGPLDLVAVP
ncbi:MAG TPA: CoA-transferase [Chloroflexota bacterium]|nr:CoA-transferase [Chloroflexota bacterium]